MKAPSAVTAKMAELRVRTTGAAPGPTGDDTLAGSVMLRTVGHCIPSCNSLS